MIAPGDTLPDVNLTIMGPEGPEPVSTDELFGAGTSVLFAVPGAFTPTCSAQHLPGYIANREQLGEKGVDRIVCMAVNDIFVMNAWGEHGGVDDGITMAADGNGEFARAIGLTFDASAFGMGERAQRFAIVIRDGKVDQLFVEAPGEFRVSSAEHVLDQLS